LKKIKSKVLAVRYWRKQRREGLMEGAEDWEIESIKGAALSNVASSEREKRESR